MNLSYTSVNESASSSLSMDSWIAKLQEGKKSLTQLQTEMLESTTENIAEFKEKAAEKAKEAAKEEAKDLTANKYVPEDKSSDFSKEDIVEPSEVTSQDLCSPIDLKL